MTAYLIAFAAGGALATAIYIAHLGARVTALEKALADITRELVAVAGLATNPAAEARRRLAARQAELRTNKDHDE